MGYRPQGKRYRLNFPDPEYNGLEIIMGSLSVEEFTGLNALIIQAEGNDPAALAQMLDLVASKVISWNVEDDDGVPVAVSRTSLLSLDFQLVRAAIGSWVQQIGAIEPPLPGSSNGAGRFPEASIPMASLSPSRQS